MKFNKCECGQNIFMTTKTVYHDLLVTINDDGSMIDGDHRTEADMQPDEPYGMFSCIVCHKTYSRDELMEET